MIEKQKYRYISFELLEKKAKTCRWWCLNSKTKAHLGEVEWHSPWRCYIFRSDDLAIFNEDCLLDVADFLRLAMEDHKKAVK